MKKSKFVLFSALLMLFLVLGFSFSRVKVCAYHIGPGYPSDAEFLTYPVTLNEADGPIIFDVIYPSVIFLDYDVPVTIHLVDYPSNVSTVILKSVTIYSATYTIDVYLNDSQTVNWYVSPVLGEIDSIHLTELEYRYGDTTKSKILGISMPVDYYSIERDYYEPRIEELQDSLDAEFDRGYDEGYQAGHEEGFGEGRDFGYDWGYSEATEEIDGLGRVVPSVVGSIWLVISDFLSIRVLGIALWEFIGGFVAIGLAVLVVRMFL